MIHLRLCVSFSLAALGLYAGTGDEFFEAKIRPLLAANCYSCHTQTQMGGLRLDSREALINGGKSGASVVPGNPGESLLIQAVRRTHSRLKMPPTAPLKPEEITVLEEWVRGGAVWPEVKSGAPGQRSFWSFQPLSKTPPPKVNGSSLLKTPVDNFILARLEQKNIPPNPPADKITLLRRVTLDLTGLPPTPSEVDAFQADNSPQAFRTVVERLLASPHYGERWARYWLDLARYSDGLLAAGVDTPLPNAYRYRDWVVDAFNKDLPYDKFVKAQIAGDLMDDPAMVGGLGFQALALNADDQVDVTTKVFLGFTVGCAQCHDHKYDPIPTRDYYSLLGVFRSSAVAEHPLVGEDIVKAYKAQKDKIDARKQEIDDFLQAQQKSLVDALARNTARYMLAAWKMERGETPDKTRLDEETLQRWVAYLKLPNKEHPYMSSWFQLMAKSPTEDQVKKAAQEFQVFVLKLLEDSKEVDDKNYVAFGGKKGMLDEKTRQYTNIVSLPVLQFYQWRELASGPYNIDGFRAPSGIYYYDSKAIVRFLNGVWKDHLDALQAELKELEKQLPPMYPFLHALKERPKPADIPVAIRGDAKTPGEIAPRQFLSALSAEPRKFTKGSGRLELAESIASHPLAARVIVNRMWQHHFGRGIVRTTSNFGQMGERPTHPELLDYLARKLIDSNWSLKAVHREILLSNTYALSSTPSRAGREADPDNRLLWRANVSPRLDMESLRDSVLTVSGKLDRQLGGPASEMKESNPRRSLYLTVSRTRLDATMSLFDFPDPNGTTDERPVTIGPLQGLYFLNSKFISEQSRAIESRLAAECGSDDKRRVQRVYQLLYGRTPDPQELALGLEYVAAGGKSWQQYVQVLLGSGEFTSVR
ncbi:MAG TPA: PSD1 and planctomycete cytochrome C domain-containing protein [Bryobacteraceae bacterium]|nr:PSD1 and planctomycete cytochrome C domain-containing protein [Bryobacteraceae bacterium]